MEDKYKPIIMMIFSIIYILSFGIILTLVGMNPFFKFILMYPFVYFTIEFNVIIWKHFRGNDKV
jgi:hypothetical protein